MVKKGQTFHIYFFSNLKHKTKHKKKKQHKQEICYKLLLTVACAVHYVVMKVFEMRNFIKFCWNMYDEKDKC